MKKISALMACAIFAAFFSACDDEQVRISTDTKDKSHLLEQAESIDKASYAGLENVFLDTKNLYTQEGNKITLFIFSKNNCIYCDKLKDDIANDDTLKTMLQTHFLPYYINVSYTKKHILHIGENTQTINTYDLMTSYVQSPMRPTPTLVFVDSQGKSIYEFPGYLPKERMAKLLQFMASNEWVGKDSKYIAEAVERSL